MGEHGQRRPAVPGSPAPDLVLIEPDQTFGGLERFLDTPPLAGHPRPGRAAAPAAVSSSAGRHARRWCRCGGSANGAHRCRCRPRRAAETTPTSRAAGRALWHRRSGAARHAAGSGRAARRRGSGRRGWARAGWPRRPARSPTHDRARRPATAVGAVNFIAGYPRGRYVCLDRAVDPPWPASAWWRSPCPAAGFPLDCSDRNPRSTTWAGRGAVDQGVPTWGGVGQVDRDWEFRSARGAAVLALHPDRVGALLDIAGLVDHQDRSRVAERVDDVVAQVVAHRVGVPARPRQQMLQPVGGGGAAVLGDGPAILAVQARDHPQDELAGMPQGFVAGESRRNPVDHRRVLGPPPIGVYAVNRGDRGQFYCLHKHRTMPRSPPRAAQTRPEPPAPIYGCSTRGRTSA